MNMTGVSRLIAGGVAGLLLMLPGAIQARQREPAGAATAPAVHSADNKLFLDGFNAYQKKEYPAAIQKFHSLLAEHPRTTLRSLSYYWLLQSYYWSGNLQEAARYHASLLKEFPAFQLQGLLNREQQELLSRNLPGGPVSVAVAGAKQPVAVTVQSDRAAERKQMTVAVKRSAAGLLARAVVVGDTYIEIRTEGPVPLFRSFREREPERLVIDIQGAGNKIASSSIPVRRFAIKRVRIGGHAKSIRFVVDAAGNSFPDYEITATEQGVRIDFKKPE